MIAWPIAVLAFLIGFYCGMAVTAVIVLKEKKREPPRD